MGFALSDMTIECAAFGDGGAIPRKHTGEGEDVSPAFTWGDVPSGTKSFALICHDPDAPLIKPGSYGFVHWVLYNIPAGTRSLPEGSNEHTCGINDFGNTAWGGPMPPNGHGTHRYFFWLFALSANTTYDAGLSLWDLLGKIEPQVLGMNRVMGTYARK